MKNPKILGSHAILIMFSAIVLIACGNTKSTSAGTSCIEAEVITKTMKDAFPGVESNLRKTRAYVLEMSMEAEDGTEILSLLVDSVRIPIRNFSLEGELLTSPQYYLHGSFESVKITARQYFYNQDYPEKVMEEMEYEASGVVVPKGEAWLEYSCVGEVQYLELGPLEKLKTEMHP
jgi:hypothetical protein